MRNQRFRHVVYIEFKTDKGKTVGTAIIDPRKTYSENVHRCTTKAQAEELLKLSNDSFQEQQDNLIDLKTYHLSLKHKCCVYAIPSSAFITTQDLNE